MYFSHDFLKFIQYKFPHNFAQSLHIRALRFLLTPFTYVYIVKHTRLRQIIPSIVVWIEERTHRVVGKNTLANFQR